MAGQYGIKESLDVVDFVGKVVNSLAAHKADDGKLDTTEIITTLVKSAPAGVSALVGSGDIDEELKDLSPAEKEELISRAMPVLLKLAGMFVKIDSSS